MALAHYTSDTKILELIELLKSNDIIRFDTEFCRAIGMKKQNLYNVKTRITHFTPEQIQNVCIAYNINANWVFGLENKVFKKHKAIVIKGVGVEG